MRKKSEYRKDDEEILAWITDEYAPELDYRDRFVFENEYGDRVTWYQLCLKLAHKWPDSAGPPDAPWSRFIARLHLELRPSEPLESDNRQKEESK